MSHFRNQSEGGFWSTTLGSDHERILCRFHLVSSLSSQNKQSFVNLNQRKQGKRRSQFIDRLWITLNKQVFERIHESWAIPGNWSKWSFFLKCLNWECVSATESTICAWNKPLPTTFSPSFSSLKNENVQACRHWTWVIPQSNMSCVAPRKVEDGHSMGKKRHTRVFHALPMSLDFLCRQRETCGGVKMEMIHTSVLFRNTRLYSGKCNESQWASTNPEPSLTHSE